MTARTTPLSYLPALTGIRAVAAGLVFGHHMAQMAWTPWIFSEGYIGVTIFFALSGYLITRSYSARFLDGTVQFPEYWFRRAARIIPVYLAVLGVKLAWTWDQIQHPGEVLAPLTLTQAFFGQFRFAGLNPGWSLTLEECFYLVAPPLWLLLANRRISSKPLSERSPVTTALVLSAVCWGLWQMGRIFPSLGLPWYTLYREDQIELYSIFGRMPEFAIGVCAALHFGQFKLRETWKKWCPELVFLGGVVAIIGSLTVLKNYSLAMSGQWGHTHANGTLWVWLSALGAMAVIWSACNRSVLCGALLGNRVVEYLGRISFVLYLLQDRFIIEQVEKLIRVMTPLSERNPWATYLALSLLAAILYEGFEKPIHQWLLGRFFRSGTSPTPSSPRSARKWILPATAAFITLTFGAGVVHSRGLRQIQEGPEAAIQAARQYLEKNHPRAKLATEPLDDLPKMGYPQGNTYVIISKPSLWPEVELVEQFGGSAFLMRWIGRVPLFYEAESLREQGNPAGALLLHERFLADYPKSLAAHFSIGLEACNIKNWSRCAAAYAALEAYLPDHLSILYNHAIALEGLAQHSQAISRLKAIVEREPANYAALIHLYTNYRKNGQVPEARLILTTLKKAFPQDAEVKRLDSEAP